MGGRAFRSAIFSRCDPADTLGVGGTRATRSRPKRRARRARRPAAWVRLGRTLLALVLAGGAAAVLAHRILSSQLDARLASGLTPPAAMVFGAPLELRPGLGLDRTGLADRLGELGYARRDQARRAGEYAVEPDALTLIPREGPQEGRLARVRFAPAAGGGGGHVAAIEVPPGRRAERLALDAPHLSTLHGRDRRRRRAVTLADMPDDVVRAVLAAEDHRFFDHPGIDPVRIAGAAVTNLTGDRSYLVGASTLTQQLIKNTLLSAEQTVWRKLREQALALLLERRLPKPRILELYLNEVYLGHRGSFAIHGVAQGARALFGKDLRNLTLGEAATMAGLIRAPQTHAPHRHPERARERRNGVLQAMVDLGLVTPDRAMVAAREPLGGVADPADREAPYLVDFVRARVAGRLDDWRGAGRALRIETTVDLHLQRLAETAVREGLDRIADRRGGSAGTAPQAALVAVDPRSGAIRAMVGGRSYQESQFNRVEHARRQPGSVVKPFVYLAALERAAREPGVRFTPASVIDDRPTTFRFGGRPWRPANYGGVYDGPVTARAALARSLNVAAVKVGELAGLGAIANLWAAASGGATPPAYPSIVLGSFEATPLEVAAAYTVLANRGVRAPLHAVSRVTAGDDVVHRAAAATRSVARPDSAFLVTSMLRSTLDTGTAASARRRGFAHDAAGKTGTSNDLRDAWFAGFTPALLVVVWVGLDDDRPLGLTGAEAALPIWTEFMRNALAGQEMPGFMPPPRVTLVDVCPDTGLPAAPGCPRTTTGAFAAGTEPGARCHRH